MPAAPDFSIATAWWLAWTTLILVMTLVLSLLLLRWQRWRNEPQQATFHARWSTLLMRCALGDDLNGQLPTLKHKEIWPFTKLWLHCQLSLKGPSQARLAALGHTLGCPRVAMRKLNSAHTAERLMAILALGFLQNQQAQLALLEQLHQGSSQTALHASRALLEIDAHTHAPVVVQALLARDDLDFALASVLLSPFQGPLGKTMMTLMPQPHAQATFVPDLPATNLPWLRLARALALQIPGELLAAFFLSSDDIETLIAAMRLAQGERGTKDLQVHAQHPDWRVRAQVANALGRIGGPNDIDLLVRMATDAQWWVRYRATHALLNIPGLSPTQAQTLIERTADRYAADMLQSAMSQHEIAA